MELIPPTPEQLKTIREDINLNDEQHKKDTTALKEWLKVQPHLPHDIDDKMLASFIVGCKNDMERAKRILDAYLSNRTSCPVFYSNRDPCDPVFRRRAKLVQYMVLPGMTPEGYRVTVFRMVSPDVSSDDFDLRLNAIKLLCSYDVRLLEDGPWAGDILVLNCKHFGLKHLQSIMSISVLKKYVHCASDSLPVRYKKVIFINLSSVVDAIISLMKKLLKQKLVQRIITTTEDYPFLYKHIPRDILPNEYGGNAGEIDELNDLWQLKIEQYRDWFLKDMTRKVDETKRPKKNRYRRKQELDETEESFRTLNVD